MAAIQSLGVGSGIDVEGLVDKLVTAEGDPVRKRLDRKEADLQDNLTALGVFSGALANLKESITPLTSQNAFKAMSLGIENEDVLSASLGEGADAGVYDIQVEQLAESQRLVSGIYNSPLSPLGSGMLSFQFGEFRAANKDFIVNPDRPVKNITINQENNNLRGIKNAINDADMGVRASIINDGSGFRLILSSEVPGTNNQMRIRVADDDGNRNDLFGLSTLSYEPGLPPDAGQNMRQTAAASDAVLRIDGVKIRSSKNSIDDVIQGVTLDIGPQSVGNSTTVRVFRDKAAVAASIEAFITQYNDFVTEINGMTKFDPETKQAGPLAGEGAVRRVMSQMRRELGTNFGDVNQVYASLSALGFDTDREGVLKGSGDKLAQAIDENVDEVAHLFAQSGSTSDPLLRFVKANEASESGRYVVVIDALAEQGKYTGAVATPGAFTIDDSRNEIVIRIDSTTSKTITLNNRSYNNLQAFAAELQSKINGDDEIRNSGTAVNVEVQNNQLVLVSRRFGSNSNVEVLEVEGDLAAITGLTPGVGELGKDVQGAIGGRAAIGAGQNLTGQGIASGIEIEVLGGDTGRRGDVMFSRGVATRMSKLLDQVLGSGGVIQTRTNGVNTGLQDINREREKLEEKLSKSEARHLKTFSNLDALVGKMRTTGEYLDRQLANLPGAASTTNNRRR